MLLSFASCDAADSVSAPPPATLARSPGAVAYTPIGPSTGSFAFGVNDAGQVAGGLGTHLQINRAFVWTPSSPRASAGTLTDIGTLGGTGAYATGINNTGWVVGGTSDVSGAGRPFLWTAAGGLRDFGLPPEVDAARDINDAGQVVGTMASSVARWTASVAADGSAQASALEELGALPGATGSTIAFAINAAGQAVGWSVVGSNHAVLWTRVATGWIVEDLGMPAGAVGAVARDINDAGLVVGYSRPSQGCPSAVVWTTSAGRKTGMRVLPTLGGCGGEAYGVNNQGDVVGRSWNQKGLGRATLWTVGPDGAATGVKDLGAPTPNTVGIAYSVNARLSGVTQAVGFLEGGSGGPQATLWTIRH
jgi:uncharacterized membrane protein